MIPLLMAGTKEGLWFMETSLLMQGLLWGGLLLGILSELFRMRIQGNLSQEKILCFDFAKLKFSFRANLLPALIPIIFGVVLQYYGGFSHVGFMIAGVLLPWLLSSIIGLPALNGLLLLGLAWLLPIVAPGQLEGFPNANIALVSGLLLFQLLQSMNTASDDSKPADARLILPATLWLISSTWIQTAIPDNINTLILQSTTAIFLAMGAIFRLLPISTNSTLEQYGKPLALALASAGGICLLGDILFHQPALTHWAVPVLGSIFAGYYFSIQHEDKNLFVHNLLNLALLGVIMLAASRLLGTLGWLVVGLGMALSHIHPSKRANGIWQTAALFLLGRSLLQVFVYNVNPNVTGINITHPYAGAALFGGIALMLSVRQMHQRLLPGSLMAIWTLVVLASCYYLHAEATGSLLVSSLFAAGALTFVPGIVSTETTNLIHQSKTTLMLLTTWLISYGALAAPGIDLGNSATKMTKLLMLLIPALVGLLILKLAKPSSTSPAIQTRMES